MKQFKLLVKDYLTQYVVGLRKKRGLSQEKMAERLHITGRAYGDLERGKYCFSAVSLLAMLMMLNETELKGFFDGLRDEEGTGTDFDVA